MKKNLNLILLFLSFFIFLSGCTESHKTDQKVIKTSSFTDIIFKENILLPNKELAWNMTVDEFMGNIYGAEQLDPDNEAFDSYRYFYSEEQDITTLSPPIYYSIDTIPQNSEVIYAFHKNSLFKSGYSWKFKEDELDYLNKAAEILINDLNSNPHLIQQTIEIPNFSKNQTSDFPFEITWTPTNSTEQSIHLLITKMQNMYLIEITVSRQDMPDDNPSS